MECSSNMLLRLYFCNTIFVNIDVWDKGLWLYFDKKLLIMGADELYKKISEFQEVWIIWDIK